MVQHSMAPRQTWDATFLDELEQAFDYRGDVTVKLKDGSTLVGYLFNRDLEASIPFVEMLVKERPDPVRIVLAGIAAIERTGVDTAAGKSWELWLKKVAEAEANGTIAELYPDEIDG